MARLAPSPHTRQVDRASLPHRMQGRGKRRYSTITFAGCGHTMEWQINQGRSVPRQARCIACERIAHGIPKRDRAKHTIRLL